MESYTPGLNTVTPLADRLTESLADAKSLEFAVAYAKTSGVARLLKAGLPEHNRAVVGLGFALTDPVALDHLDDAGVDLRVVGDASDLSPQQFHPKLYLVTRQDQLVVLSGSANLTGGGLVSNVEQYEELRFSVGSSAAGEQHERFERLWDMGTTLRDFRRSSAWAEYRARVRDRRKLEQDDRRRLLRLHGSVERIIGSLARRPTRAAPGYLGITHPRWWEQVLAQRYVADRALFWRRRTESFEALAPGGLFFHLVKSPDGEEESRAVEGFSVYSGYYERDVVEDAWARYRELLGVHALSEVYERLEIEPGRLIGIIHLENVTELDRPVPLAELRANGIEFARNIVSGRSLALEEVATIVELGGFGGSAAVGIPVPAFRIVPDSDVRPYENAIPLVSLQAAAGGFGSTAEVEIDAWVAPAGRTRPGAGLFVARVVGRSMNRRIPDGAYCVFHAPVAGSRQGRVLLVQHRDIADPDHGGSYTVKVYESAKQERPGGSWSHTEVRLKPDSLDPHYRPIVLTASDEHDVRVIAELVEVLPGPAVQTA